MCCCVLFLSTYTQLTGSIHMEGTPTVGLTPATVPSSTSMGNSWGLLCSISVTCVWLVAGKGRKEGGSKGNAGEIVHSSVSSFRRQTVATEAHSGWQQYMKPKKPKKPSQQPHLSDGCRAWLQGLHVCGPVALHRGVELHLPGQVKWSRNLAHWQRLDVEPHDLSLNFIFKRE